MKKSLLLLLGTLLVVSTLPYSAFANQVKGRILTIHGYHESQSAGAPNSVKVIRTAAENGCREADNPNLRSCFSDTEKSFITPIPIRPITEQV